MHFQDELANIFSSKRQSSEAKVLNNPHTKTTPSIWDYNRYHQEINLVMPTSLSLTSMWLAQLFFHIAGQIQGMKY